MIPSLSSGEVFSFRRSLSCQMHDTCISFCTSLRTSAPRDARKRREEPANVVHVTGAAQRPVQHSLQLNEAVSTTWRHLCVNRATLWGWRLKPATQCYNLDDWGAALTTGLTTRTLLSNALKKDLNTLQFKTENESKCPASPRIYNENYLLLKK
jgi:hypothetical protein